MLSTSPPAPLCPLHPSPAAPEYAFEQAASEAPLFPELLQPGRRAVLLAVDPDLGGAVAALSWHNPPAGSSGHDAAGVAGSDVAGSAAAAGLPLAPGLQLRIEVHDMPVEVWRYGSRDKRQPDAQGLIAILRRYQQGSGTEESSSAASSAADGNAPDAAPKKRGRRKAAGTEAEAAAAAVPAAAEAAAAAKVAAAEAAAAATAKEFWEAPRVGCSDAEEPPVIRAVMEYSMPAQLSGKYAW